SQMLASTSALTEDIYHRIFRKKASQKELIWVGRVGIIVIAAIALVMAMHPDSSVIKLVAFAWAGLSASFGPCVVGALFWRRMTRRGAICGILLGSLTVILWKIIPIKTGIFSFYEIIPGFVLGTLGVVIGSLLDKAPEAAVTEQFDKAWQLIKNTGN
ncbi:MAG TPA: hypothetical protein PLD88_03985, partial [Candidatus Berkiella sp.]|nr:hypothetical protein [Candidatus Berkiella sp.]